ncbi:MAG: ASKHA domain-containing protein [Candidatus Puniceispirillum sp.]
MGKDTSDHSHSDTNTSDDVKIVFTPSGRQGRVPRGTPVLTAARQLGVDIDSVCGGRAMCGRCQVDIGVGHFAKHGITAGADCVDAVTAVETRYADKRGLAAGRRLSCQARLCADAVIDVPPESQVHNQLVRKQADGRNIAMDPVVRLCYVAVREPDMHDPSGDLRRLIDAVGEQWPDRVSGSISCDFHILRDLQTTLRQGDWHVTVALRDGNRIIAVWPGLKDQIAGIAIDVGSTTMSAHLCDMVTGAVLASTGAMNPQIRFGEDLMSRVSYGIMNPGGAADMTKAVIDGVQGLIDGAVAAAGLDVADVVEMVLVGNPVMHHLLIGVDPVELGGAPFALAVDQALDVPARDLGVRVNAGARAYLLPCIAGHVGADAAAVVLAEAPQKSDLMTLIVDVGTNAEIIVGNADRLLAASSPTGPAFEGAQISSGQRAAPGAIERVRIDRSTLEPRFAVIGSDLWSDSPDFDAAIAQSGVTGICGSGIIEVIAEMYLAGIVTADGVIDGSKAAINPRIEADGRTFRYRLTDTVVVTQNDIRAIQLAKAALYAGFRLLMDKINIRKIDRVVLAGAFGTHIDPKYAMVLGMIPDCLLEHVRAAGNAAGTGARMALLNRAARHEIEAVVRRIEKIETAVEPSFQDHFVKAMAIPHKSDPYAALAAAVDLPPRDLLAEDAPALAGGRRRGGRRR